MSFKKIYKPLPTQPDTIPALYGFRGLAALLVVAYHYFDAAKIFRFGWMGVDMLLVLSGYLLTRQFYLTPHQQGMALPYLGRRALRILPLYALLLMAYFYIFPALATPSIASDIQSNQQYQAWYYALVPNWLFVTEGYPAVPHLAYLWTIGVQVQFYVLLLLLMMITKTKQSRVFAFSALMLAGFVLRLNIWLETPAGVFANYMYNTLSRMDTLFAGSLLYVLTAHSPFNPKKTRMLIVAALALLLLLITAEGTVNYTGIGMAVPGLTLVALVSAGIIYWVVQKPASGLARFFCQSWLQRAGYCSYSLYLVHVPVFAFASGFIYQKMQALTGNNIYTELGTALICFILSCALAWAGYRFAERKLYSLGHPASRS